MHIHNPAAVPFVTTVTLVGGTWQFAQASGQLMATGDAVGSYTGTICKPEDRDGDE